MASCSPLAATCFDEFIEELSRLQNEVPPSDWADVRALIAIELGSAPEVIFATFDPEPFAAASIAQVHRATLLDGRQVAVKIQRPGIIPVVERDLDIVDRVARSLERRFDWANKMRAAELAAGFAVSVREELDFRTEAKNLVTISEAARAHRDDAEAVKIPAVMLELSTSRVLIMEFIDGISLGRADNMIASRGLGRAQLARTLLNVLLRQVMVDGIFHADPHPGNILLLPDGTLALLRLRRSPRFSPAVGVAAPLTGNR